jgi:hypothetical protein
MHLNARGFFKALFLHVVFSHAFPTSYPSPDDGDFDAGTWPGALEIFSAKLLTSRFPVISFRPADVNCGNE